MSRFHLTRHLATALVRTGAMFACLSTGAATQNTWRVSVNSSGQQGNYQSWDGSISADGRFSAFTSDATNLVKGDGPDGDVFVHDRRTRSTFKVSVDSSGRGGDSHSGYPSISSDGRLVAFCSLASNLVPGDTNGVRDTFVHDRQTGITTRVSVSSTGVQSNGTSKPASISGDGRFVAFQSGGSNLVPGDTNGYGDVFVHDLQSGTTTRVSVSSTGVQSNGGSSLDSISGDGRFVAFNSAGSNLVSGDTNNDRDVFVHDRLTGQTTRVNVDSTGAEADGGSWSASISADGQIVAFQSYATNLVLGDTNGMGDIFAHDRLTGQTTRVSVDSAGSEANGQSDSARISGNGTVVVFQSWATNLVPGDTNHRQDAFRYDRQTGQTTRISVDSSGVEGNDHSFQPTLSADGRFAIFGSPATNLVPGDTNGGRDVFVHGPHLTLEATPEVAPPGTLLSLTTWGGLPSGQALLVALDINGSPTFARVTPGSFDSAGLWTVAGTVPASLAGFVVTFATLGVNPDGKAEITNPEVASF